MVSRSVSARLLASPRRRDIREQIARGIRPRADYLELAHGLDADILDYTIARSKAGFIGAVPTLLLEATTKT